MKNRRTFLATCLAMPIVDLGHFLVLSDRSTDEFSPIPLERMVFLTDVHEITILASHLANSYGQPECTEDWTNRLMASQAVCLLSPKNRIREWWFVLVRSDDSFCPMAILATSAEAGNVGLLMARITFRLHRFSTKISKLAGDPPELLRLINRQIIEATKGLPG